MSQSNSGYVSNRILRINVGFLLSEGPGHHRDFQFDVPQVRVADDIMLRYVRGNVRFSRTKEGILVQGALRVGVSGECGRCLDAIDTEIDVDLEELFAYPALPDTEFNLGENGQLDLSPLLRDEVLIAEDYNLLCRSECKGLCLNCGTNLNHGTCACGLDDIDPRLAKLKELLDRKD